MRPLRLEIEGFTAFRERTEIEFSGADLFALVGPTGSGKSSVIDAMIFALYGSIPRYDDPRLVYPVISQGKLEMKVRFDFAVGESTYTAVRVVRRRGAGAVAKEARLECGDEVLASGARELNEAVWELLGLTFGQFTTCVVLPQGDFARFLHDKPADRQDLLVRLLNVGLYERMGRVARARQQQAEAEVRLSEEQLDALSDVTPAALRHAKRRVKVLDKLLRKVESIQPELEALDRQAREHLETATRLNAELERLGALEQPEDVEQLTAQLQQATEALAAAEQAHQAAADAVSQREGARRGLPATDDVSTRLRIYEDRRGEKERLEEACNRIAKAERALAKAQHRTEAAERQLEGARASFDVITRAHAAYHVATALQAGEPCPVCQQPVSDIPDLETPERLEEAAAHRSDAEAALVRAQADEQTADRTHTGAVRDVENHEARIQKLDGDLAGSAPEEALQAQLAEIKELEKQIEDARGIEREAKHAERQARKQRDKSRAEVDAAWSKYDESRDSVASSEPPAPDRGDLSGSWRALLEWAEAGRPARLRAADAAAAAAEEAASTHAAKLAELVEACAGEDVAVEDSPPRDAVVDARAEAVAERDRIAEDLERAAGLRERRDQAKERAQVARALAGHLRANAFERWLLNEAFQQLVEGASQGLRELSNGEYSFAYDERLNFEVVDHRNADERRLARTLSGGETFLASLALALALSDQIRDLAARGAPRLESIFLDEGFGTLDAETLDTVAAAIEELGAGGRVVGLVTHVRDLADRVPVQYRVTKGATTASVEKVVS